MRKRGGGGKRQVCTNTRAGLPTAASCARAPNWERQRGGPPTGDCLTSGAQPPGGMLVSPEEQIRNWSESTPAGAGEGEGRPAGGGGPDWSWSSDPGL